MLLEWSFYNMLSSTFLKSVKFALVGSVWWQIKIYLSDKSKVVSCAVTSNEITQFVVLSTAYLNLLSELWCYTAVCYLALLLRRQLLFCCVPHVKANIQLCDPVHLSNNGFAGTWVELSVFTLCSQKINRHRSLLWQRFSLCDGSVN